MRKGGKAVNLPVSSTLVQTETFCKLWGKLTFHLVLVLISPEDDL